MADKSVLPGKLGKAPARRDPRTLQYRAYKTGALPAPPQAHWGHIPGWTMLGNDKYGDCVEAAYAHMVQGFTHFAKNPWVPQDSDALTAYTNITGFNPANPNTDQGTDMLTACNFWVSAGMSGHKVNAFLAVTPAAQADVQDSIAYYGGLYIGMQLPVSAQNQVGTCWSVVTGPDSQAGSWGGHCVPVVGYTQSSLWVVTWGTLQELTWEFLMTYTDEAYVFLDSDYLNAKGLSPKGLSWGTLMGDLNSL